MPRDINIVARNLNKMIDQGAPENETDLYLKTEGYDPNKFAQLYRSVKAAPPVAEPITPKSILVGAGRKVASAPEDLYNVAKGVVGIPKTVVQMVKHPVLTGNALLDLPARGIANAAIQPPSKTIQDVAGEITIPDIALGVPGVAEAAVNKVVKVSKAIKALAFPEARSALMKAIKPAAGSYEFKKSLDTVIPIMKDVAERSGTAVSGIEDFNKVLKMSKQDVWDNYESLLNDVMQRKLAKEQSLMSIKKGIPSGINPEDAAALHKASARVGYGGIDKEFADVALAKVKEQFAISGDSIRKAAIDAIKKDARYAAQNPEEIAKMVNKLDSYKGVNLTPQQAEEYLQSVNAELQGVKYGKGMPLDDRRLAAEAENIREQLYKKLELITGGDAKGLKQKYSALLKVEKDALKRANVVARQNPVSLQEAVNIPWGIAKATARGLRGDVFGAAEGMGQVLVSKGIKELNKTDNLIKSVFESKLGAPISLHGNVTRPVYWSGRANQKP